MAKKIEKINDGSGILLRTVIIKLKHGMLKTLKNCQQFTTEYLKLIGEDPEREGLEKNTCQSCQSTALS